MRIIRCTDPTGEIHHATYREGSWWKLGINFPENIENLEEPIDPQRILTPIVPSAILCVGLNYRQHAEETGAAIPDYPILFMKSPGSLQNPGEPILLPRHLRSDEVDYEAELAVVIGKDCKNIREEQAHEYVLGYTCANDVSARDWQMQRSGRQWCRAKSFDTFCPLGPELVTPESMGDPQRLRIESRVNGKTLQTSNTRDMIFSVAQIIAFLSGSTTLKAGTVILTGTPEGVGMARRPPIWLHPGDMVEIEIEGIGILRNPVEAEPHAQATCF